MFPEETASYKFVHTEQKKSLVHARNYHKISCHTPSQPVENSPLFMNKKILIRYWCPAHKNHHLSPKIKQNPDS